MAILTGSRPAPMPAITPLTHTTSEVFTFDVPSVLEVLGINMDPETHFPSFTRDRENGNRLIISIQPIKRPVAA